MAFCQSFMTELCKYIGADTMFLLVISEQVQERSVIMFGQYKRIRGLYEGV